jgi:hypothetical protein
MKLDEWRKGREFSMTLTSGLEVRLRRLGVVDLAAQGRVPAPLVGLVNEVIEGGGLSVSKCQDFEQYGKLVDLVVMAAMIEPKVAEHGDAEHLGLDELTLNDKTEIFEELHREANRLAAFRSEQAGDVGTAPDSGGVSPAAEWNDAGP